MDFQGDPENTGQLSIDDSASLSNDVENARFSLHAALDARKAAERDAKLLLNRINLLRNEEMKALKNIEITRAKAKNLANIKQDAIRRYSDKQRADDFRAERTSVGHERNNYMREVSKATRAYIRKQVEENNARKAYETRMELQRRIEEKLDEERAERDRILRRTEAIKQERIEAKKRIEAERIERLKSFRAEYENRLALERQKKQESDALIARLEKEELELIDRLRRAQDLQTRVYDDINMTCPVTPIISGSAPLTGSSSKPRKNGPIVSPLGKWDVGGAALR
jgi:hypothetical protein